MIRPDFQRATVISFVAHLLFFLTALAAMGFRSPHKTRVYTISLVSPERAGAPAISSPVRRTPPPKKVHIQKEEPPAISRPQQKTEKPEMRTPPVKKDLPAPKEQDPAISGKKAREAIDKLRMEQEAREAEEAERHRKESLKELEEKARLEELRNSLAAEGASDIESQVPEGELNDILSAYRDTIIPLIKGNWVFPDVGTGIRTEVSITVFVDGTVRINKITIPSGNRAFDQSVLKAIIKTGKVPPPPFGRDEDITLNFIPVNK